MRQDKIFFCDIRNMERLFVRKAYNYILDITVVYHTTDNF